MPSAAKKEGQRRWLPVIIACCVLIGGAMWVSALLPADNAPADAPRNTTTTAAFTPQTLRVWEGKLARFEVGGDIPVEVYDVVIATLPAEAQQELQIGVVATSEQELAALLENYTS